MLGHWNKVGGPFKDGLNQTLKYVASSKPDTDLPWPNSSVLTGDVPAAVAALREQPGGNLVIMGSGQLIRTLLPHGLVDEMFRLIHPVVLGSGQRLFGPADDRTSLTLIDTAARSTGVIMATYRP
jgi:dihydrofolate reductase